MAGPDGGNHSTDGLFRPGSLRGRFSGMAERGTPREWVTRVDLLAKRWSIRTPNFATRRGASKA